MTRLWVLMPLLPLLLLSACSTTHGGDTAAPDKTGSEIPQIKTDEIRLDLIRQMIDKGQYYAALANIEDQELSGGSDELTLLEADARSQLGQRAKAEALYRRLLKTRQAGSAYHGLGLLYAKTDLDSAIRNLRYAVERAPTNVDFRNDLGYALMQAGRYTEAMPELSTAAELAPTQLKSRNNLIVLMMLVGDEGSVQRLARDSLATPEKMRELRDSAQQIRDTQNARVAKAAG